MTYFVSEIEKELTAATVFGKFVCPGRLLFNFWLRYVLLLWNVSFPSQYGTRVDTVAITVYELAGYL